MRAPRRKPSVSSGSDATPSVSGAEHYAKIVMDTALLRRLIHTAGEITDIAFGEPDDVVKAKDGVVFCPFEKLVWDVSDPEEAHALIRAKLAEL